MNKLSRFDLEVANLIKKEEKRQRCTISLIASENFASQTTLDTQGTIVSNKLCLGYVGRRTCGGCEYVDRIETLAIDRAKTLFGADHVNVQAASASIANLAVYHAMLQPGDTVLAMREEHGGHNTHGSSVNLSGRVYNFVFYELDPHTERLNYETIREIAFTYKPRLIITGYTNYSRIIDFSMFRNIADEIGAFLMVDMAHIVGLIIAGFHPSPIPYADVVTTSTHKTFRGPRGGGIILCRIEHAEKIDRALSPGLQAAPMMNLIAARAVLLKEAMSPQFTAYQRQIVKNAKMLSESLLAAGFKIFSGGTDTHVLLVDLRGTGITGDRAESILDMVGITVNRSRLPFDYGESNGINGIRLGTPGVTTRGMKEEQMKQVAEMIVSVLRNPLDPKILDSTRKSVRELTRKFPLFSKEWEPDPDCRPDPDFGEMAYVNKS
jgi:glycine hydroxymethyltransferase